MRPTRSKVFAGLVVAILATTCLGFGSWFRDSAHRTAKIELAYATKLKNGDVLPAGQYQVQIAKDSPTPTVKFYKVYQGVYATQGEVGNKVVASVKAKVVTQQEKNPTTEVLADMHGNEQILKSIQPAGWEEKLVFGPGSHSTAN